MYRELLRNWALLIYKYLTCCFGFCCIRNWKSKYFHFLQGFHNRLWLWHSIFWMFRVIFLRAAQSTGLFSWLSTHRYWILNIKLLSLLRDYLQTAETWRNQEEWEESWAGSSHSGQTASSGTVWRVWACLSSELSSPGWSHCIAIIQVARYLYVSTITEIWKVSVWWHTEFPRNQRLEMLKVWRRTLNWSTFNI